MTFSWKLYKHIFDEEINETDYTYSKNRLRSFILENGNINSDKPLDDWNLNYEISDIICDVHFILEMRNIEMSDKLDSQKKNEYKNKLVEISEILMKYINWAKGSIARIEHSKTELSNTKELNKEFVSNLHKYIEGVRDVINFNQSINIREIDGLEIINQARAYEINGMFFSNIKKLEKSLEEYVSGGFPGNRKVEKNAIYSYIRKIPYTINEHYQIKSDLMQFMNKISRYYPKRDQPLIAQMIINEELFNNHSNKISLKVIDDTQKIQHNVCIESIYSNESYYRLIREMKEKIDTQDGFAGYRNKKNGCFALMELKRANNVPYMIFSFSNMFECTDTNIINYLGLKINQDKWTNLREVIKKLNASALNGVKWARTIGDMNRYFDSNNKFIASGESLNDVMKNNYNPTDDERSFIWSSYTCCERKMLADIKLNNINNIEECYLFTRHKPCYKCIPAIDEFKSQNHIKSMNTIYFVNKQIVEEVS